MHRALTPLLVLAACGPSPEAGDGRPNVLLVVVDSLRRDRVGCYGGDGDTSPTIDGLAERGWLFTRAMAQAPWSAASIGSLLASRWPGELGLAGGTGELSEELDLFSEVLQREGYRTGAVVSHAFCSSAKGFDQGFDRFDDRAVGGPHDATGAGVTARALDFVDSGAGPFFLLVHYSDPRPAFVEHGGGGAYDGPVGPGLALDELLRIAPELDGGDVAEIERLYEGEVRFVDRQLDLLLGELRKRSLEGRTIVAVCGAHGEELFDRGSFGHAMSLHDEVVGVPLVLAVPGEEPAIFDEPVGLVDVHPTLLDLLGVEPGPDLAGVSVLDPGTDDERPIFVATSRAKPQVGVVAGGYKLIRDEETGRRRLFHVDDDPRERSDLAATRKGVVGAMTELLDAWLEESRER